MSWAQPAADGGITNEIRIDGLKGVVEVSPSGATTWVLTQTNQVLHPFDRLRTGPNSMAALRWSDQSLVSFDAWTEIEILPPHSAGAQAGLHLVRGVISFFHRDKPGRIRVITRGAAAGVEGTEFVVAVSEANNSESTTLSVIDGKVQFGNDQGTLLLTNGQQAVVEAGKAPERTAGFIANNILQWSFYYPAVLDLDDLPLTPGEQEILRESLAAYRAGDLQAALAKYPATRQTSSEAERVYYAALLLSVGQVGKAESEMASLSVTDFSSRPQRLAKALRQLIAAVKRQPGSPTIEPQLATEFMASSYYEQSRAVADASLKTALHHAKQAATHSPAFGFAWARVAELEFSFGRTSSAMEALDKGLSLSPRNAQALALKGFLLAARNQTREATAWFEQAIAVDYSLGNAWLGRGLCRIRQGDAIGGRKDLLVAAALEPQRAELRSYLGKAYASAGDYPRASKELQLAKGLDPNDPTAWLYSALLNQEENRINDAIGDLEKSQDLNDNRSVYRSQLLLDQDQAVRSANLATMYRDAGMLDVSVREASRSVSSDYANYSAHLFLANSYNQLRDPNRINLRYDIPASVEYFLANLLAPVGAGTLSPTISQQEYSRLFVQDRWGVVSSTEYLSRGAWSQSGAQYGTIENFSYSVEGIYRSDPGQGVNNDIELRQVSLALKYQINPQDSVFAQVSDFESESGDVFERYNPTNAEPGLRIKERQDPFLVLGYHHEWSPGVHTLFLAGRAHGRYSETSTNALLLIPATDGPQINGVIKDLNRVEAAISQEIYSTELQQIWQQPAHTTIVGGSFQWGDFHNTDRQTMPINNSSLFEDQFTVAVQDLTTDFERFTVYGYQQWQIADSISLIGGVSYEWMRFPKNFRAPPFSDREETKDQVSPKAGLIWTPARNTTVRAAYTRSLGGASLDQGFRLEPTEVAGLNQVFRSIIPDSVGGANAGARFETYGLSLEQKFSTGTYLGLYLELLDSQVKRNIGVAALDLNSGFATVGNLRENLDYCERSIVFTVDQLLGRQWSVGTGYRLTCADLTDDFPGVPIPLDPDNLDNPRLRPHHDLKSTLHHLNSHINWNHPSGFFATAEANWYLQDNDGFTPAEPGDEFWQFNLFVGYRFAGRRAEAGVGLLNITDQDYRLEPLTLYNELPRERTFVARFQFNF